MTLTVPVAVVALVMIDCLIPGIMHIGVPIANRVGMTDRAVVAAVTVQRVEVDKHRVIDSTVEAELLPPQIIPIMIPGMKRSMAGTSTVRTIVTDVYRRMGVVLGTVTRALQPFPIIS